MKFINIGFGNMVNAERIIAIISPESAPIKRIIQVCKENGTLIDATHGRRTRAVIITDCDQVILTYLQAETVANRLDEEKDYEEDEEDMVRYKTVKEMPSYYQKDIQKLIELGHLKGKGGEAGLDLTEDMIRILIINGRMNGILEV